MLTQKNSTQRKWHRCAQIVILGFVVTVFSSCSKGESADMSFLALLGGGGGEGAADPDPSCTLGHGSRIDVGTSMSFFTVEKDPDTDETIECSFKAQFNDGSEKVIFLTADGNGETTVQKDSCGNEWTVTATEQDKFLTAEMSDQFFENITANPDDPSIPANSMIIPGAGETNEPTNGTHVSNVRSFVCQYD
jgi:hypothetical protein